MPRSKRTIQKPKKVPATCQKTPSKPSKTLDEYFPPSPPSPDEKPATEEEVLETKEVVCEIVSETVCYVGPTEDEPLDAKEVNSLVNLLPTPEDSPEKSEKALVFSPEIKSPIDALMGKSNRRGAKIESKQESSQLQPSHQITEYFSVRKSNRRKTAKQLQRELAISLLEKTVNKCTDGLEIKDYGDKGRGVMATKSFGKGEFVVEYEGDLVEVKEAYSREEEYKKDTSFGCYMYFFSHKDKRYCIDATAESGRLGRLLNHSRSRPNCVTKSLDIAGDPHLILVAARDIEAGEELVYDYGDRDKEALQTNPWLKD